jgi:hypothetical protein
MVFRPTHKRKSALEEATEIKLDVGKTQIVHFVEHPDDTKKPMQGKVL